MSWTFGLVFVFLLSAVALSLHAVAASSDVTLADIRWGRPTRHARIEVNRMVVDIPKSEKSTSLFGITGTVPAGKIGDAMALRATVRARGADIVASIELKPSFKENEK